MLAPYPPFPVKSEATQPRTTTFSVPILDLDVGHIPRPRNAFICFRSDYVKEQKIASARPGSLDQTVLSRGAAEVWRGMTEEERSPFLLMALHEKREHALRYPNYRYAPGSSSGAARKNRKPKPATPSRASATSESSSARSRSPIPVSRPSHKYETNPPASRPVSRRKSSTQATPRPKSRVSSAATAAALIGIAAPIELVAEVPAPAPAVIEDNADKKADEVRLFVSSFRDFLLTRL